MQKVIDMSIGYKKMGCIYFRKKYGKSSFCHVSRKTVFLWNALIITLLQKGCMKNKLPERLENRFCVIRGAMTQILVSHSSKSERRKDGWTPPFR